jgi:hypothetical protein
VRQYQPQLMDTVGKAKTVNATLALVFKQRKVRRERVQISPIFFCLEFS